MNGMKQVLLDPNSLYFTPSFNLMSDQQAADNFTERVSPLIQ